MSGTMRLLLLISAFLSALVGIGASAPASAQPQHVTAAADTAPVRVAGVPTVGHKPSRPFRLILRDGRERSLCAVSAWPPFRDRMRV